MKTIFEEISEARRILELPERASLLEIKRSYRALLNKWHPDKCPDEREICEERTREIIGAYKRIVDYCNRHQFSFSEEELQKTSSVEEWWFKRFGNTPWWGK